MTDEVALWKQRILERKVNRHTVDTKPDTGSVIFAKVNQTQPIQSALQVTWQDVRIHLSSSQEAHLAAELIAYLRCPC